MSPGTETWHIASGPDFHKWNPAWLLAF
jgi:hypothetical protein